MSDGEERCLRIFLEWYNKQMKSNYKKKRKMDQDSKGKMYDYLCEDTQTGSQIAVEISSLFDSAVNNKFKIGWAEIFSNIRKNLEGKLNGTFMLHTPISINYKKKDSKKLIKDITEKVLNLHKTLKVGEDTKVNISNPSFKILLRLERINDSSSQIVSLSDHKCKRIPPEYVQNKVRDILEKGKNDQLGKGKETGIETFLVLENNLPVSIGETKGNKNIFSKAFDEINYRKYSFIDHVIIIDKNKVYEIYNKLNIKKRVRS